MSTNLKLPGFTKTNDQVNSKFVILIDKKESFGKRSVLTQSGKQTNDPTQLRIIYKSNDGNKIVYLDYIYVDHFVGNNLLYTDISSKSYANNKTINSVNTNILSYKNTLIKVTLYSLVNPTTRSMIFTQNDVDKNIVDFLKKND